MVLIKSVTSSQNSNYGEVSKLAPHIRQSWGTNANTGTGTHSKVHTSAEIHTLELTHNYHPHSFLLI